MSETALHELRESIQETVEDDIPYSQRLVRLRAIQQELVDAQAEAEKAVSAIEEAAVAEAGSLHMAAIAVRERATTAERLISEGMLEESEAIESGLLLHEDLDALETDGLFEATVQQLVDEGKLGLDGEWLTA